MKKRLLCPHLPKKGHPVSLSEDEGHHALRVLRLRDGEKVEAIDGSGKSILAILRVERGKPRLEALEFNESGSPSRVDPPLPPLVLEMAVLKGEAMEWVIEKAVELGVQTLIPILTDHTVVQIKSKPPESFQARWQKIADQALKQCGRLQKMTVHLPTPLETLLASHAPVGPAAQPIPLMARFWCDEGSGPGVPFLLQALNQKIQPQQKHQTLVRILVGPEGGWSTDERALLMSEQMLSCTTRVTLGPRILRAETAALFAISIASAQFISG